MITSFGVIEFLKWSKYVNVLDILKYGDLTLLGSVKDLPEGDWKMPGVCGWWSVKEIIAHMTSFEFLLADVLNTFLGGEPGSYMQEMAQGGDIFNENQVGRRQEMSVSEVLDEYKKAHARIMELAARIPSETYTQNGSIPWYGLEYCLDDYIVYTNYAHKREHSAQIGVYRDQL